MTELTVRCRECRTDKGRDRIWRWLCEHCAEECRDRHIKESGHRDVAIDGEQAPSIEELVRLIRRTRRITGGR